MELEAEVAKLKEENQELQKKQVCFVVVSHSCWKHELTDVINLVFDTYLLFIGCCRLK